MTKPPNPITQGLRTVSRDPLIFMLEILWRWSFALLVCLLLFGVGAMLLGPLPIGDSWAAAWHSQDPRRIGQVALMAGFNAGEQADCSRDCRAYRRCSAVGHFIDPGSQHHSQTPSRWNYVTPFSQHHGAPVPAGFSYMVFTGSSARRYLWRSADRHPWPQA